MTELNRQVSQSITEYMDVVDKLSPTTQAGLWFRGHSSTRYRLLPSALRDTTLTTDARGFPVRERQIIRSSGGEVTGVNPERMLAEFKRQARPFVERPPVNDFEWMFIAQHHGLPTRLLDWSTNALVALYFAVSGASVAPGDGTKACDEFMDLDSDERRNDKNDGFAVFVLDPGAINKTIYDVPDPIDVSEDLDRWAHYLDPASRPIDAYAPICIVAPHITSRIRAQSGTFTLHGSNIWPLDYYDALRPLITKIFIPYSSTEKIRMSLAKVGLTKSFIYPGLDSIAQDVCKTETVRHLAEKRAYFG